MMHRRDFDPWGDPAPLPIFLTEAEAGRKALRAFLRGAIVGVLLGFGATVVSAAFSLDISGSTVTLEPSADPAAFADVVFFNNFNNGPTDTRSYALAHDGMALGISFVWDSGAHGEDRITVTPPAGMTCQPANCSVTVIEGQTGRVTLYDFLGS